MRPPGAVRCGSAAWITATVPSTLRVEDGVEEGGIARFERPVLRYAGAIHQHIDVAEPRNDVRNHRPSILGFRDVAGDGYALRSHRGDLAEDCVRGSGSTAIADRNSAAGGGKASRNGGTDAARAAGDHDDLAAAMGARRMHSDRCCSCPILHIANGSCRCLARRHIFCDLVQTGAPLLEVRATRYSPNIICLRAGCANNRNAAVRRDIATRPAFCHGYSTPFRTVEFW